MNINQKLIDCSTAGDLAGVKEALENGANIHVVNEYSLLGVNPQIIQYINRYKKLKSL